MAFLLVIVVGSVMRSPVRAPDTLHGEITRDGRVQRGELLRREPFGQEHRADGDQEDDEDGEADGGDGLRDGEGGGKADELEHDEVPDDGAAGHLVEGVGGGRELLVAQQEEDLGRDAVFFEGLVSHDEEQARQDTLRDEAQDDEQGTGHGSQGQEALREVGDALLDDVGAFDFPGLVVGAVVVDFVVAAFVVRAVLVVVDDLGHAEGRGVERSLGNEAIGEGQAQDTGYAGGEAQEEDIPVEARGLFEWIFRALGDEGGDYDRQNELARRGVTRLSTQKERDRMTVTNHCDRTKRGW